MGKRDKYDDGDLSTSSLLRAASQIAGLGPSIVPNAENDKNKGTC